MSTVTILEQENRLRQINGRAKRSEKPGWKIRIESRIEAIRKKLSHTYTLLQCLKTNKYTKHQLTIKRRMAKQYGRCTTNKLKDIQVDLKQDLKVESIKLKKRKTIEQIRFFNGVFRVSPKTIYRQMKGQAAEKVKDMPTKQGLEDFWGKLWGTEIRHNTNAPWLNILREKYCHDVEETQVNITDEIMQKILNNVANNKHGRDLITGQWVKQLKPLHSQLKKNMIDTLEGKQELPDWSVISQTLLLAKTKETDNPQNYRPIALQNTTYKIYTALMAEIIMQHCTQNKIITEEQEAGKRGSWGTTDQLLINKMIYDQVTSDRRSLAVA